MSLSTHSKFYFGYEINADALYLDFKEGAGPELSATVAIGSYSLEEAAVAAATALTAAGSQTYTASVDRTTRKITVSAASAFTLLVSSGSHAGTSAYGVLGFSGADTSSATSHQGNAGAGTSYATQFILQSYIPSTDYQQAADAVVNKAASGRVEVVTFGTEKFIEMNFKFVTDRAQAAASPIRENLSGVSAFRTFMQFLITKGPVEFMPDESSPGTFETVILESTPSDSKGVGYKMKELYDKGLPGFYESGTLKFRVVG
jgi:hypothetical protein